LDNPWETCNGSLAFDRSRIASPKRLIEEVHARGVKLMLWISPRATCPQGYPPGSVLGQPGEQILDLRRPATVAELRRRLRRLLALGVDGFKADRGDENDLQPHGATLDDEYPLLFARAVMGALPAGGA